MWRIPSAFGVLSEKKSTRSAQYWNQVIHIKMSRMYNLKIVYGYGYRVYLFIYFDLLQLDQKCPPVKMASSTQALLLLGLLFAASVAHADASVTVLNGALIPVDVYVKGSHVTVNTGMTPVYVDIKGAKQQTVMVSMGKGKKPIYVNVKNGDTVVIIPDILGGGTINVNVNGVVKGHF